MPTRLGMRLGIGAALVAALAAFAPTAQAAQPGTTAPNVTSLRAELRDGSLLATHGVRKICAAANGHCLAQVVTSATGSSTALSTTTPLGYGPADFANAYHLPAADVGANGTI